MRVRSMMHKGVEYVAPNAKLDVIAKKIKTTMSAPSRSARTARPSAW
jgi:hypothetical protein